MSFLSPIPTFLALILAFSASLTAVAQDVDTEFKLAAGFYGRGQWDDAADAFRSVIQRYPESNAAIKAKFFAAETAIQKREFEVAYRQYQEFLTYHSQHPLAARAMFRMGEAAYRIGNRSVSLRMLEEFTREYPDHELNQFALPYIGQLRIKRGEPQLAERVFNRALDRYPDGPMAADCQLGLGKAKLKQGDVAGAERIFKFCLKAFRGQSITIHQAKILLGQCALATDPANHALAQQRFEEVIAEASSPRVQAEAILALAKLHNETDRHEDSLALLEPILGRELDAELKTQLLFEAALASTQTNHLADAIDWLRKIRAATNDAAMLSAAVRFELKLLQSTDQSTNAIRLAEKYNLQSERRLLISTAQEKIGREQFAQEDFRKSLATFAALAELENIDPKRSNVWHYFRALNLIGLEQFSEAELALQLVDQTAADARLRSLVQFCLGSVKFRQKQFSEAIPHYQQYLGQNNETDDRGQASLELTLCLAETGQFGAADKQLQLLVRASEADEIQEHVIEEVAKRAAADGHPSGAKWFWWLAQNSQVELRKDRANIRLVTLGLDEPLDKQPAEEFKRLFSLSPGNPRLIAAAVKRAADFENTADWPNAILLYRLLIANPSPKMESVGKAARLKLASCYQKTGNKTDLKSTEDQLQTWLSDISQQPKNVVAEVLYQLAWVQTDLGKADHARDSFRKIVNDYRASKYWPDAAYRTVEQMAAEKQYETAKKLIAELVVRTEVPAEIMSRAYFLQGKLGVATGDWELTESAMSRAGSILGDSKMKNTANYFLAESRYQLGKSSLAARDFSELYESIAAQKPKYQPWVELRLANLLLDQGQTSRASKIAAEAHKRYIDFDSRHEFIFVLGRCHENRGLLDDARMEFEKVIESNTGNGTETAAHAQWRIGETFFHQEKFKDAIAAYYKVDSLYNHAKWQAAALLQAGKCQEHLANPANATKLYEVLLRRYPNSEFAAETGQRLKTLKAVQTKTATKTSQQKF